jgi:hypothetical protein
VLDGGGEGFERGAHRLSRQRVAIGFAVEAGDRARFTPRCSRTAQELKSRYEIGVQVIEIVKSFRFESGPRT